MHGPCGYFPHDRGALIGQPGGSEHTQYGVPAHNRREIRNARMKPVQGHLGADQAETETVQLDISLLVNLESRTRICLCVTPDKAQ